MSKNVSKNIEIVTQLWYSDASGRHAIPVRILLPPLLKIGFNLEFLIALRP